MRVTKGNLRYRDVKLVKAMYHKVKSSFNFISEDLVTDMFRVLEDKESIHKAPIIFKKVLADYAVNKVSSIFESYYAHLAYARFLKMMCDSPHYPTDPNGNADFFDKMWLLLAELWKRDFPQVNGIPRDPKLKHSGKIMQGLNSSAADQLSKLVECGQKILELLKDPLFEKMFPPPGAVGNIQSQGDDSDDENWNPGGGGYSPPSSLNNVVGAFQRWSPYMVEAMLFSHDLALVSKINPKGKWAPTPFPDNRVDIRKMQSSRDLMKLLPGEYALPSDLFYVRFAKKELQCREFLAKQERKQVLYILLDNSGSMHNDKIKMAASVVIALLRKVVSNGDIFFFRFFSDYPGAMHKVDNLKKAQDLIQKIIGESFSGGGTDVQAAVMRALGDIKNAVDDKDNYAQMKDAQVLLLTDGDDSGCSASRIMSEKGKVKIHGVVIHGTDQAGTVQTFSDTYYHVSRSNMDQSAVDIVQMVSTKGKP